MPNFIVTLRNSTDMIINNHDLETNSINHAKKLVTQNAKAEDYAPVEKWENSDNKSTRKFEKDGKTFTACIQTQTQPTETEAQPTETTETEETQQTQPETAETAETTETEETEIEFFDAPLNSSYEVLRETADNQRSNLFTYADFYVGQYLNLFLEVRKARITRILETQKGIRFLVRFKKGHSIFTHHDLKRSMNAARVTQKTQSRAA